MIKSMTAYAKAAQAGENITAEVTIRSYNSRYLDYSIHLPDTAQAFEEDIKKIIAARHNRGRMEIRVTIRDDSPEPDLFEVDVARARSYYKALDLIRKELNLETGPDLDQVLSARNLIQPAAAEVDRKLLWGVLSGAVETAAAELDDMRRAEGDNLQTDLAQRIDGIEARMAEVETLAKEIPKAYKKRLEERVATITADTEGVDPMRLAQEVAILADKSDVSEEIVRLHSHIRLFRDVMAAETSQGRKLNFLIQEFNREFNTIGSKAGNADLSHLMVDLKSELEKIREQVQNIE